MTDHISWRIIRWPPSWLPVTWISLTWDPQDATGVLVHYYRRQFEAEQVSG